MLVTQAWIIDIREKISIDNLWHVINTCKRGRISKTDSSDTPKDTALGWENYFLYN